MCQKLTYGSLTGIISVDRTCRVSGGLYLKDGKLKLFKRVKVDREASSSLITVTTNIHPKQSFTEMPLWKISWLRKEAILKPKVILVHIVRYKVVFLKFTEEKCLC